MVRNLSGTVTDNLIGDTADNDVDPIGSGVALIEVKGGSSAVRHQFGLSDGVSVAFARDTLNFRAVDEVNLEGLRGDGGETSGEVVGGDSELEGTSKSLDPVDLSLALKDTVLDCVRERAINGGEQVGILAGVPHDGLESVLHLFLEVEEVVRVGVEDANEDTLSELRELAGIELDGARLDVVVILGQDAGLEVRLAGTVTSMAGRADENLSVALLKAERVNEDAEIDPGALRGVSGGGKNVLIGGAAENLAVIGSGKTVVGVGKLNDRGILNDGMDVVLDGLLDVGLSNHLHTEIPAALSLADEVAVGDAEVAADISRAGN